MLQVNGLYKSYGSHSLLEAITFNIEPRERVGFVGKNGSGKSTLFRMILGQEAPDSGTIALPPGYRVAHLQQHIRFDEDTVLGEACRALPTHEDGIDLSYKAQAVLLGLGFSAEQIKQDPMELSGGYQVRLNLAKALVSEANLLLLDEPTNHLDIVSIRWLQRFLREWRGELVLITHDRSFMDAVSTHTMAIYRKGIRKIPGPTSKLYGQIRMEEEHHERSRINEEKRRRETEAFIERFRYKATKARAVQSRIKALERRTHLDRLNPEPNLDFRFNELPFTGKLMLEISELSFSYGPDAPVLIDKLSFTVKPGDRIGVIGKNGKGKSTLLSLIAGELQPTSGNASMNAKTELAYFGQTNVERLHPERSVVEEVMDANPALGNRNARTICGLMLFEGALADKRIQVLSGGERSRVLLGRLLAHSSNLLLLDEPTNHLDMESVEALVEAVDDFEGAVLIVTHSEMMLEAICDRLIIFDGGTVRLFEGGYEEFLERIGWQDEVTARAETLAAKKPTQQAPAAVRKDIKRARAELINARSRALAPLKRDIETIEADIMQTEERLAKCNEELIEVSGRNDGEAIVRLSRQMHEEQTLVDELFARLEHKTTEHEEIEKDYAAKLNELGQE